MSWILRLRSFLSTLRMTTKATYHNPTASGEIFNLILPCKIRLTARLQTTSCRDRSSLNKIGFVHRNFIIYASFSPRPLRPLRLIQSVLNCSHCSFSISLLTRPRAIWPPTNTFSFRPKNGARGPTLRFWESPEYFVALGYTNRAETEANLPACAAQNVPVLRRVSGGGTVMQGPGCLNYALVHPIAPGQTLNVEATNKMVMETQRAAFEKLLGETVSVAGHTDLATGNLKFSGNAQRRKARNFLFHGTILLDFDLELVQRLLRSPSKEPEYRARRSHREFIRNLPVSREEVKNALRAAWGADDVAASVEAAELDALIGGALWARRVESEVLKVLFFNHKEHKRHKGAQNTMKH